MLISKNRFYLMWIMAVVVLVITGTCEVVKAEHTSAAQYAAQAAVSQNAPDMSVEAQKVGQGALIEINNMAMYRVYHMEIYYTAEMELDKVEIINNTIEKYRDRTGKKLNNLGNGVVNWIKVLKEIKGHKWKK